MATKSKKVQAVQTALVLRCCNADMSSKNGFVWPGVGGIATAPDWKDNKECGNGLHGWLYGQGDHSTSDYFLQSDAKWLVVKVVLSTIIMLGGKCKFQSGEVVFVGMKSEAADYIIANEPQAANVAVIGLIAECGENGVLQGGTLSVLTGGYSATMTGGYYAVMHFQYWDGKRTRTVIAYVGEDGILAGIPYRLNEKHLLTLVEATK